MTMVQGQRETDAAYADRMRAAYGYEPDAETMTCAWCGATTDDPAAMAEHDAEHCDVCGDPDGCVHTWKVGDVVEVRRNAFQWFRAEVTGVDVQHDAVAYRADGVVGITTSEYVRNREVR